MTFKLPDLPYDYDALEPHIDAKTMEVHHDKHHAAYTDKFNAALAESGIEEESVEKIFSKISNYPAAVRNNGGGYYNHNLFWTSMAPNGGKNASDVAAAYPDLAAAIDQKFGSFEDFKNEFSNAAATIFGSGWAWLVKKQDGSLTIAQSQNQNNPLMDDFHEPGTPLLLLDVWEHSYYLKYQNRRPDYIEAFWNVVNWEEVAKRFNS